MNTLAQIDENSGEPCQTKPLRPADRRPIATVVAIIEKHFIEKGRWCFFPRKGSVTLQHCQDKHQVIKVFVDCGNDLSDKTGLHLHDDPIVVGVELTPLAPYVREVVRDSLRRDFMYYVDPRQQGCSKWWLQPIGDHFYDLIFMTPGDCELSCSEARVDELVAQMENSPIVAGVP